MTDLKVDAESSETERMSSLIWLVGAATFFQGYCSVLPGVIIGDTARTFETQGDTAIVILAIALGTMGALFLAPIGDRRGRRPLLIWSTLAFSVLSAASGLAGNLFVFAGLQFLARAFVVAGFAAAIALLVESVPGQRRGWAIGIVSLFGGAGVAAATGLHRVFTGTQFTWRATCLFSLMGLLTVLWLRSGLEESQPWKSERLLANRLTGGQRMQLMQVTLLHFFAFFGLLGTATWWTEYASNEAGLGPGTVENLFSTAFVIGLTGYLFGGWFQDRVGRRRAGTIFLLGSGAATALVFQVVDPTASLPLLAIAAFLGFSVLPVLTAVTAEIFPTRNRTSSLAYARAIGGTAGGILGPLMIGFLADRRLNIIGNISDSAAAAAAVLLAAVLVLRLLPETGGRELASIAAATDIPDPQIPTATSLTVTARPARAPARAGAPSPSQGPPTTGERRRPPDIRERAAITTMPRHEAVPPAIPRHHPPPTTEEVESRWDEAASGDPPSPPDLPSDPSRFDEWLFRPSDEDPGDDRQA